MSRFCGWPVMFAQCIDSIGSRELGRDIFFLPLPYTANGNIYAGGLDSFRTRSECGSQLLRPVCKYVYTYGQLELAIWSLRFCGVVLAVTFR